MQTRGTTSLRTPESASLAVARYRAHPWGVLCKRQFRHRRTGRLRRFRLAGLPLSPTRSTRSRVYCSRLSAVRVPQSIAMTSGFV